MKNGILIQKYNSTSCTGRQPVFINIQCYFTTLKNIFFNEKTAQGNLHQIGLILKAESGRLCENLKQNKSILLMKTWMKQTFMVKKSKYN